MKVEEKPKGGIPLFIIIGVLVLVVAGAYWMYNSSSNGKGTTKGIPTPAANASAIPVDAPPGATPPNMLGSPTAAVTVEEFADFQCPSCGDKHPVMKQIQSIYGSRIKFIFRNFPLPMHDKAYEAAVAAEAAGIQGKFWDMHNQLYTNQKSWSADTNYREVFVSYAQKIGLDVEKFKNDMAGIMTKNRVGADVARGKALGINSTPTVFINGKSVPYPDMTVETLRQLIDADLQAAGTASKQPSAAGTSVNVPVKSSNAANAPINSNK